MDEPESVAKTAFIAFLQGQVESARKDASDRESDISFMLDAMHDDITAERESRYTPEDFEDARVAADISYRFLLAARADLADAQGGSEP